MNYKDKSIHYLNSKIMLALLIVLGGMLAFISASFFFRIDLTQAHQYSISSATQTILKNLKDPVNIRVYFSKQLPPEFLKTNQYVKDILTEYKAYAKQNIEIRYLDPKKPEVAKEALTYGIPRLQMNVFAKDRFEIKEGYLGLAVVYQDRFEALPVIENTNNLEYDLTSAIKKVVLNKVKTIGLLTENGAEDSQGRESKYQKLTKALEKNYHISQIDFQNKSTLSGIDTLVIIGSKKDLSDTDLLYVDQFMTHGGKVIFLVDSVSVDSQLMASDTSTKLNDFLSKMGVGVEKELIVDRSNANASFNQGFTTFIIPYAFWVKLIPKYFMSDSPIMNKLSSLVIPWGSPLNLQKTEGLKSVVLAKTTQKSAVQKSPYSLNPGQKIKNTKPMPSAPMVAMISGTYNSYFKDSKIKKGNTFLAKSATPIRAMVIGNSRFIEDRFINRFPQNLTFFMNSVDYLTLDDSLIGIRSKAVIQRPIKELSDSGKQFVKFLSIYFIPILVILAGIFRAYWLKKIKKLDVV